MTISNKVIAGIVVLVVVVAGVYWYTSLPPPKPAMQVCIAYDVGGRGDKSFNDMAYFGVMKAKQDFGINVSEITPLSLSEMENVLRTLSKDGKYGLILCIGYLWTDALTTVSKEFPNQKYAGIDIYIANESNVLSVVYREEEGSALVGALAALVSQTNVTGNVLGMEIPLLWKFEIGFKFGAQYVYNATGKHVKVLWQYTGSFGDPTLGRESAISMMDQKADVVWAAAGGTGLGALDVVAERGTAGKLPFAIGVDADQDWLHPGRIIASMQKRVDTGTYTAVKEVVDGTFTGGVLSLGLKENGIAVSDINALNDLLNDPTTGPAIQTETGMNASQIRSAYTAMHDSIPSSVWSFLDTLKQKIISGEVVVPVPASDTITYYRTRYG